MDAALETLTAAGCASIAVSGALAVDEPGHELLVAQCAQKRGLPACVGHDLTGAYGLEMRTVSAAVNASILPVVQRTASLVEQALADAGLDVPLLVLRGDGGAMSVDAFRRRPCFTIGSGPAAGVAAALHQLGLADAIVVECGGTSPNVSVVKGGRPGSGRWSWAVRRASAQSTVGSSVRPAAAWRFSNAAPSPRRDLAAPTSPACRTPASPIRRSLSAHSWS